MPAQDEIPSTLIDAARQGGSTSVDRLVAQAWPHAFRIAHGVVRDRALAEDAAQEACAILYRKIRQLRQAAAFRVWFYRIVMREALRLARRETIARSSEGGGGRCDSVDGCVARIDVARALRALSHVQRAVVVLHFYAGMTSSEIAAVLRMPPASVRFHLMRARRILVRLLDDRVLPAHHGLLGAYASV